MLKNFMFLMLAISVAEYTNCMPPPALNPWCNCVRVSDCIPWLLSNQTSEKFQPQDNAGCGFTAHSEPMICCPTRIELFDSAQHQSESIKDRWIWERRPLTQNDNKLDKLGNKNKFNELENRFINSNLINDYVDWKTHRNCPPVLFKDMHKNYRGQHFPPKKSHGFDHYHFHRHRHHHHNFHHHPHDHFEGIQHVRRMQVFRPTELPENQRPYSDGKPAPLPAVTTTSLTPTVNSQNCGVTLNKRIIGGTEALPGEFPWITRIAYVNRTDNSVAYRCSGSFISELHILTAAHCVANLDTNINLSHISIADSNDGQSTPDQEQLNFYEIAETIVHPNYDSPKRANDIAIIKIYNPPNTEVNYGTICLPSGDLKNNNLAELTGVVAGWPNNEGMEITTSSVRYVRLNILNNTDCAESYNAFREGFVEKIAIIPSMICTRGKTNSSDVCRGDSGGPLMDDGSGESRYTLLGIVAFGPLCGLTNLLPGVYMRVSEYFDWIISNVK